jgi:hypothetical protein
MPPAVADDEEAVAVEDTESDRGYGEEIHGRNRFLVILKKLTPTFDWLAISGRPVHPARDGSLRSLEPQH